MEITTAVTEQTETLKDHDCLQQQHFCQAYAVLEYEFYTENTQLGRLNTVLANG